MLYLTHLPINKSVVLMVKALRDTIWLIITDWSYSWAHWPAF